MKKLVCILSVVLLLAICSLTVFADPHVVPDTNNVSSDGTQSTVDDSVVVPDDSTTEPVIIICGSPGWGDPDID